MVVDVLAGASCIGSGRRLPDAEAGAGVDGADGGNVHLFDRSVMVHQQVAKTRRLKEQLRRGNAAIAAKDAAITVKDAANKSLRAKRDEGMRAGEDGGVHAVSL